MTYHRVLVYLTTGAILLAAGQVAAKSSVGVASIISAKPDAPSIQLAGNLSAKEIKVLLPGAKMQFSNPQNGRDMTNWYNANGTFNGEMDGGGRTWSGTWWVKEPHSYCHKARREICGHIEHLRGDRYRMFGGNTNAFEFIIRK